MSAQGNIVVVWPGDTIIFTTTDILSEEDMENLREQWKPLTEDGIKIAFAEGISSVVVVKPESEES